MAIGRKKDDHLRLGRKGERMARRYLKRQGWKIVEKNYKCPFGEVDIVANKGGVTAFIEVKTRSDDGYGAPSQAVDVRRQSRYIRAAKYYFIGRPMDCTLRFDVIEVCRGEVNHIENAFQA